MKKLCLFLLFTVSVFSDVYSTHFLGGYISWECLSTGEYIFKMELYRNCKWGVANIAYNNKYLSVVGNSLPRDSNNVIVDSILMVPDSAKWIAQSNGDITPKCFSDHYGNVNNIYCTSSGGGGVQSFYYTSNPIRLVGVPPPSGWRFNYLSICCMSDMVNLQWANNHDMLLRSIMYPTINNNNTDPCHDSSPEFAQQPWPFVCIEEEFNMSFGCNDYENDQLKYSFGRAITGPIQSPINIGYNSNYSFNNPTPDTSFNSNNIASQIDSLSGQYRAKISTYSSDFYKIVIRVDGYRDGVKISSVFKDFPLKVLNCPLNNNYRNNPPKFSNNIQSQINVQNTINVKAGELLQFPFSLNDTDIHDYNRSHQVRLMVKSIHMPNDLVDSLDCFSPPCATIKNARISYDIKFKEHLMKWRNNLTPTFEWQTNCNHLNNNDSAREYFYYFRSFDDFCPMPGLNDSYIKVVVEPLSIQGVSVSNNVLTSIDSVQSYQWYDCFSNSIIQGETNRSFAPNSNGQYAVILSNNFCTDTSQCYNITTVGLIGKTKFGEQISCFPNPSKGEVTVMLGMHCQSINLKVRNVHGQVVKKKAYNNVTNISLSLPQPSGIYYLEVVNEDGSRVNLKVVRI